MRDFRRDHPRPGRKRQKAAEAAQPAEAAREAPEAVGDAAEAETQSSVPATVSPESPGEQQPEEHKAPTPEAATPDAPTPEAPTPESKRADSKGRAGEERKTRFKVVLSVLIALTSLLGALAAWQAEAASMKRDDANGASFAKSVAKEQSQATIYAQVESQLLDYERAKSYQAQAKALLARARSAGSAADGPYLRTQAALQSELAGKILGSLDVDAFGPGHVFDPNKEFEIDYALAKTNSDFDSAADFALAARQATKADRLVGLTVLLIAAAFFFTLAQVSSRRSTAKLYLGGGLAVLAASSALLFVVVATT